MEPTDDILSATVERRKAGSIIVGFALETGDAVAKGRAKLERKGLDLVAANRVGGGAGFDADENELTLLWRGGKQGLPRASKRDLAHALLTRIEALRAQKNRTNKPGARRR